MHFIKSKEFVSFASINVAGAKMPRVIMDRLRRYPVPVPAFSEQRRIVEILDRADSLSQMRAEASVKTERILPALYRKMFLDSKNSWPVDELGNRLRRSAGALQSGPFGSQLHNSDFVDDGPVRVVGIDNVLDGQFVEGRNRRISNEKYLDLKKFTLKRGDVLITIMGTVGRTCVFPGTNEPSICTKHVYRIQLDDTLLPDYVSASIRFSPDVRAQLGASTTGQIVAGITSTGLRALRLRIPPLDIQHRFSKAQGDVAALLQRGRDSARALDQLFATTMARAFDGSLTARWREAHAAEVLAEMRVQARALGLPEVEA